MTNITIYASPRLAGARTDLALLRRLADERFVLPFNPLSGPGFAGPRGPQPDPAPDVRGFAAVPTDSSAVAEEAEEDVQAYLLAVVAAYYSYYVTDTRRWPGRSASHGAGQYITVGVRG